jgi:fatty-acyl-CoA synthase
MGELDGVKTVCDVVRRRAELRGGAVAFHFEGRETTYAELDHNAGKVANALIAAGIRHSERVAYLGKNTDLYFEILLGCMKAGVVLTPINWRLAGAEIIYVIEDARAVALFVGPEFVALIQQIAPRLPGVRLFIGMNGGMGDREDFSAWREAQSEALPASLIAENDVAIQLYTSGTTGHPKGAMLSHRNFLDLRDERHGEQQQWNRWSGQDVSLIAMPVFHIAGSAWGLLGLYAGAKAIIAREFNPDAILDIFETFSVSKVFLVPTAMQFLVRHPRARQIDFSRLRYMLYGASPIPLDLLKECMDVFKCRFVQMYGMTETTGVIVTLPPEDHTPEGSRRMLSAGKACRAWKSQYLTLTAIGSVLNRQARSRPALSPIWWDTGTCRRRPPKR